MSQTFEVFAQFHSPAITRPPNWFHLLFYFFLRRVVAADRSCQL
jgi:hypothetical protein